MRCTWCGKRKKSGRKHKMMKDKHGHLYHPKCYNTKLRWDKNLQAHGEKR